MHQGKIVLIWKLLGKYHVGLPHRPKYKVSCGWQKKVLLFMWTFVNCIFVGNGSQKCRADAWQGIVVMSKESMNWFIAGSDSQCQKGKSDITKNFSSLDDDDDDGDAKDHHHQLQSLTTSSPVGPHFIWAPQIRPLAPPTKCWYTFWSTFLIHQLIGCWFTVVGSSMSSFCCC